MRHNEMKTDLTSVAFVIPWLSGKYDGNGKEIVKYLVWTHSFIPTREKLQEHILKDKAPYDAWERDGYLTVTNTPIVDQGAVMRYVLEECQKYKLDVQCLCFDPARILAFWAVMSRIIIRQNRWKLN